MKSVSQKSAVAQSKVQPVSEMSTIATTSSAESTELTLESELNSPEIYTTSDTDSSCSNIHRYRSSSLSMCVEPKVLLNKINSSLSNNDSREIFWEIINFDLGAPLYESNTFTFASQNCNFVFGHNGSKNYGFLVAMHKPQIKSSRFDCTFKLHHEFAFPLSRSNEELHIDSNTMIGFVSFASREEVCHHLQNGATIKLSVVFKLVTAAPAPIQHTIEDIAKTIQCFEGLKCLTLPASCYSRDQQTKKTAIARSNKAEAVHQRLCTGSFLCSGSFQNLLNLFIQPRASIENDKSRGKAQSKKSNPVQVLLDCNDIMMNLQEKFTLDECQLKMAVVEEIKSNDANGGSDLMTEIGDEINAKKIVQKVVAGPSELTGVES